MLLLLLAVTRTVPDTVKHVFFTGDAALVSATGNSDLKSLNLGDKLVFTRAGWKFTQTFSLTYARSQDSVTANILRGSVRADRSVSARVGLFLLTDLERNTFAGIRSRVAPSFGLTALAVATTRDTLRFEVGGGFTFQSAVPPDTNRRFPAGRLGAVFHHQLSGKSAFDQVLEYLPNFSVGRDERINSETSITAPITTGIALKASYVIHYEGLPEPGFKTTDRILTTGVQVTF